MKKLIKLLKAFWYGTLATASNDPDGYMQTIVGQSDKTASIRKTMPFQITSVKPIVIMTRKQFVSAILKAEIQGCKKERLHSAPIISRAMYGNSVTHIATIAQARTTAQIKENRKRK